MNYSLYLININTQIDKSKIKNIFKIFDAICIQIIYDSRNSAIHMK